jgi:tetratricopeptide (TPR) repeat protein
MRYSYRVDRICSVTVLMLMVCLPMHAGARGQTAPSPDIQSRLNRVGADLFSTTPHAADAIKELKAILAVEPNLAEAHMLLGIAYRAEGTPEMMSEAIAELRQAISLKPTLTFARMTLARVYLDMSRASRAKEELDSALQQIPGNPQLLSLLGEAERALGNPKRAVELQRQSLQADGNGVQARYYLGLALMDLKQPKEAIEQLQLVVQSGTNPAEAQLALGVAYLAVSRTNEAIAALRESARADPGRADTHIQLARAYRLKGLLTDAEKELRLAVPSATSGLNALYRSVETDLYMEEGLLRLQQGRLEAAAESFQKVLSTDNSHAEAKRRLAEVQKRLKTK